MLDKTHTPEETVKRARKIAMKNGIRYAYTGNLHDPEGGTTHCHNCQAPLIGRDWYELSVWGLTPQGNCRSCGTACAGVFEAHPGKWGRKREGVRMPASA
jgi:pyruvate formate lyase activating enzyme